MSPSRSQPVIGIAAATLGVAAGVAAGIAADRAGKHRAAMAALETPELLDITPDEEHVVLTADGVPLHVEIDLPGRRRPRAAADGTTRSGRPDELPTVVLTHGYCLSLRCWVYQRRALKEAGYRVVSWDQRGHGRSGRGEKDSYTIDRLGQDLHTVIDRARARGRPRARRPLDGRHDDARRSASSTRASSSSASSAPRFVATSAGRPHARQRRPRRHLRPAHARTARAGRARPARARGPSSSPASAASAATSSTSWSSRTRFASPVPRSVVRYTADILLSTPLDVVNDYLQTFDGFDKRPALLEFRHAVVLVFNGREDILTPPSHSELIVEGIPGAEHIVVNDAGHVIMLEHPDLLNAHLVQLVDQSARARAEQIEVARQPRVRRIVTDVAKNRRQRRLEQEAAELARARRSKRTRTKGA